MVQLVQKKITEFHMINPGEKVLVGVSGGADSVALLLVLWELASQMHFSVEVVHIEHGIRGAESRADADFVVSLCHKLGVECQVYSVDVPAFAKEQGLGLEEGARLKRYEIFQKLALEKQAKVALAHHQEDNAETILFQMARGSSLTGLCGMQHMRMENGVCYIRPFLGLHRREIEAFLRLQEQPYCIDSTNAQELYSRNFIRARVIPDLISVNSCAVEHVNQAAAHLSEVKDYLDLEVLRLWETLVKRTEAGAVVLPVEGIKNLHIVMQRALLYQAITEAGKQKKDISAGHVMDVLALLEAQSGKCVTLPYGVVARRIYDELRIGTETMSVASDWSYEVTAEQLAIYKEDRIAFTIPLNGGEDSVICNIFPVTEENGEIPRKMYTKWFDYDKIEQGFCIRTRRSGDYFISDALGHHKKLKSYFIDEKIPQEQRDSRWLLAAGDTVLWLIGGRMSEHIKVTEDTKHILEITYVGGKEHE